jgi:hypothetical protein
MNSDIDHMVAEFDGELGPDGPSLFMTLYSGVYECDPTDCAWVCPEYKCKAPSILHATIAGYQYVSGEFSPIVENFSIDFTLYLTYLARPNLQCWYVGVREIECPCSGGGTSLNVFRLEIQGTSAELYWTAYPRCNSEEIYKPGVVVHYTLSINSCDPISLESAEEQGSFGYCPNTSDFPQLNQAVSFTTLTVAE